MEDNSVNAPVPESSIVPTHHTPYTLLVGLIIALVVLAGGYFWWQQQGGTSVFSGDSSMMGTSQEFALHQGVNTQWYRLSGETLTAIKGPSEAAALPFDVIAIGPKTSAGTYPVLIRDPKSVHTTFGIASADGSFLPIDESKTFKEGLTVDANSRALYASFIPAEGIINEGQTAALIQGTATSTGAWHIMLVDLTASSPKPVDIGQGYEPRFMSDGSILALDSKGVVRITPSTGKREMVVAVANELPSAYAVSPDASHFALAVGDSTTRVFSVTPTSASTTQVATVNASLFSTAFLTNSQLFGIEITSPTDASGKLFTIDSTGSVTLEHTFAALTASSSTMP